MSRSTKEWIGKTDDSRPPPHVRARIYLAHDGICHISKRKIMRGDLWDLDHVVALINGGENRESNLAPALRDKHREKTKADLAEKAIVYRKRVKHLGLTTPRKKIQSPGFRKAPAQLTASKPLTKTCAVPSRDG